MSDQPGLPALQAAVTKLRAEHPHCPGPLGGCPWPSMWEEDVALLHQTLLDAGFAIARVRPR